MMHSYTNEKSLSYRLLSAFISLALVFSLILTPSVGYAQITPQTLLNLPTAGSMVLSSPAATPVIIRGLTLNPDNPLKIDFIVDTGDDNLQGDALRQESERLVKYFLAALTVPEDEMWVNLSPYEKDRIIPPSFGQTDMGRDLLAQDYLLKQLTASLIYPENELGQTFWNRVYKKAQELYGTSDIPVDTFNKVWIVPEKADVYVNEQNVFIVDSHLKVILEEDYTAIENNSTKTYKQHQIASDIIREIVIPEIEKEINEGSNFAKLRQVYHSVILATWYKENLKQNIISEVYVNKNKIDGIDIDDKNIKEKIYQQYLKAFQDGVYDFIKEDYDETTQEPILRKYFSGGVNFGLTETGPNNSTRLGMTGNESGSPLRIVPYLNAGWKKLMKATRLSTITIALCASAGCEIPGGSDQITDNFSGVDFYDNLELFLQVEKDKTRDSIATLDNDPEGLRDIIKKPNGKTIVTGGIRTITLENYLKWGFTNRPAPGIALPFSNTIYLTTVTPEKATAFINNEPLSGVKTKTKSNKRIYSLNKLHRIRVENIARTQRSFIQPRIALGQPRIALANQEGGLQGLVSTIYHELAHIFHYKLPKELKSYIKELFVAAKLTVDFPSLYGQTNVLEFFAELVEKWMLNSKGSIEQAQFEAAIGNNPEPLKQVKLLAKLLSSEDKIALSTMDENGDVTLTHVPIERDPVDNEVISIGPYTLQNQSPPRTNNPITTPTFFKANRIKERNNLLFSTFNNDAYIFKGDSSGSTITPILEVDRNLKAFDVSNDGSFLAISYVDKEASWDVELDFWNVDADSGSRTKLTIPVGKDLNFLPESIKMLPDPNNIDNETILVAGSNPEGNIKIAQYDSSGAPVAENILLSPKQTDETYFNVEITAIEQRPEGPLVYLNGRQFKPNENNPDSPTITIDTWQLDMANFEYKIIRTRDIKDINNLTFENREISLAYGYNPDYGVIPNTSPYYINIKRHSDTNRQENELEYASDFDLEFMGESGDSLYFFAEDYDSNRKTIVEINLTTRNKVIHDIDYMLSNRQFTWEQRDGKLLVHIITNLEDSREIETIIIEELLEISKNNPPRTSFNENSGSEQDILGLVGDIPTQTSASFGKTIEEPQQSRASSIISSASKNTVGGIDMNPDSIDLNVQGQAIITPSSSSPLIDIENFNGFHPMIINITPLLNLPLLIGQNLDDTNESNSVDSTPLAKARIPEDIYAASSAVTLK